MLFQILALPVSFPLWVVRRVRDEAEARYYDEKAILFRIVEITNLREQGAMDEEEFAAEKKLLVTRLKEAREWNAQREETHRG